MRSLWNSDQESRHLCDCSCPFSNALILRSSSRDSSPRCGKRSRLGDIFAVTPFKTIVMAHCALENYKWGRRRSQNEFGHFFLPIWGKTAKFFCVPLRVFLLCVCGGGEGYSLQVGSGVRTHPCNQAIKAMNGGITAVSHVKVKVIRECCGWRTR